jgi:hypothetical protein
MKDYVIVPKRVWIAFTAWYGNSSAIARPVIKYKGNLNQVANISTQDEEEHVGVKALMQNFDAQTIIEADVN